MQIRHVKTLMQAQPGIARPHAAVWSPNNKRLAVCDSGRFVNLFDESGERRDKFALKPAEPKGPRSFVVAGMAFSPDSVKIAVAQSDFILYVYRIGLEWGEKKSICNKFAHQVPVTAVVWPNGSQGSELLVFGGQDGKVKVGILKTNKSQTLFGHEAAVVSLATSTDGNQIISGHLDGAVFQYTFESEDGSPSSSRRLFQHSCVPYALSWGEHIAAAGQDCIVSFYDRTGHSMQSFDYKQTEDKEVTAAAFNPAGQTLAVACADKLRLFNFNLRSRKWEEGVVTPIHNAYSIPVLAWKCDGSRLTTGTITGAVDIFDACLRRYRLRNAFEFTYVSHNQVIVKRLSTGARIVLKSHMGYEIQRVNVHQDRYLVGHTTTTLLVGDLVSCKLSEIQWQLSGREKYVFDNQQVCMVFSAGELCLIEYGKNEVLGTCRTEETNMHRMSVRIHEVPVNDQGQPINDQPARKCIAYLIDRQTIQVDDLVSGIPLARFTHTFKIDWLELNHRANKLLFRDKQHQLFLFDLVTQNRATLLNYCSYVQWVPESDVVVAQNRVDLCVWYSIDNPDRVAVVPIKGEVEGIERGNGKTEVIVDEGVNTVAYGLDESLIEFGGAMEDRNYDKACDLLEQISLTPETEALWQQLAQAALQEMKLYIAERCFAALGDVAKAHSLNRINQLASDAAKASNGVTNGYDHYSVRAELCILNKEFRKSEQIYLDNGRVEDAMAMWDELNKFDESIQVAESRGHTDVANQRARFFAWLMETAQYEKAGELKEREGKFIDAINLFLRGGTPARAANVVNVNGVKPEQQQLEAIAAALFKAQIFEKAGDFFEKLNMNERALDAYKRGHVYSRAVEYAKRVFPDRVVSLEDSWGDHLVQQKQVDQAINHYIEAHQYLKAVQAAIGSRQWSKAATILENQCAGISNDATVRAYRQFAQHYEESRQLGDAEKFYIKAGAINEAVEMYNRNGMSDHMYRVAQRHLSQAQITELFVAQAKLLESRGDYANAERIFLKINEPDQAIVMYKKARDYTNMIRLVAAYRPDFLAKTHLALAGQFEKEGNFKLAEQHFVSGKDWGRAVNMYRDKDMWEDAVRVAKVHGGANAAKQVVLSRAMAVEAEEGVRLLLKFSLVDAGIDAALEGQKFDIALQWAHLALPAKLPYVYLKHAMYFEDQGDFRMAEDAFVKSGKPRESIDMYIHQHEFDSAMRVAENHDPSAIPTVCIAHARVCFQAGNHRDAETLLLRANSPDLLLKFYREARMFNDAQRIAREYCPEKLAEIAREVVSTTNDPLQGGAMAEDNGEYQLAIEQYLRASRDNCNDPNQLVAVWTRCVKLAQNHARHMLKDVLKTATAKMLDIGRAVEAGKCLEDCEDFKGAINMYVRGQKYELAEALAQRISPELVDYVKRARVQAAIEDGGATARDELDTLDQDAALKAHVQSNDWEKVMRLARQRGQEDTRIYAAMHVQYLLRSSDLDKALDVIAQDGMETKDFRFFETWQQMAALLVAALPNPNINITTFHDGLVQVVDSMRKSGQTDQEVARAEALRDVVHIYHMQKFYSERGFPEYALKNILALPRYAGIIPADKAYYDAGMAAKDAKEDSIAFMYLNRFLDLREKIEDGEPDSSNMDNVDFEVTDFPNKFQLPRQCTIAEGPAEEANKWVLAISIEKNLDPHLPTVKCPTHGVDMFEGALRSPSGAQYEPCAISGYPVLSNLRVRCKNCQRLANQEDWNKFMMQAKTCPWCKTAQSADFKMTN
ncbi:WD40 repeat-containing protein, putative [Bodo saltans]|uniref:WD40 repeat-containing protein, putative n=1 Tax=Bodo saltans TaxID=75058 RepID=A0A0S4JG97_BODSA|nr:WD40 repeat-containing protein, putative [Bodo saltans]|eukprot:CUG89196.1 WD40 repeat-containing protein, putative [Bodo saltans]